METRTAEGQPGTLLAGPAVAAILPALDRQARRRRQGIPTLSVLPAAGGEAAWQRWVGAGTGLRAVCPPWPRAAADLDALETGVAPLWMPPAAGLELESGGGPRLPLVGWLAVAVELLGARLERSVPPGAWVCGLLAPENVAATYLAAAPESRAKAYFREGMIRLPLTAEDISAEPTATGARAVARRALAGVAASSARCARVEAAAAALDALAGAGSSVVADGDEEAAATATTDRARSAAERFLFELLEALPETAGRFALNAPLAGGVCFGSKPAEVDLLARGSRLAVEIDGYRHFTDAEAYRRDRRKDALLQQQGFFVLRFLADDVVARLEPILEEIRAALAFQRVTGAERMRDEG